MKLILIVSGLLLVPTLARAQSQGDVQPETFVLGAKLGLNFADVDIETSAETSRLTALAAGGFVHFTLPRGLGTQIEAMYSSKGAEFEAMEGSGGGSMTLGYVELAILGRYTLPVTGSLRPFLNAGIAPAFLVSAKVEVDATGQEIDIKDFSSPFDLGLVVGGGASMAVGPTVMGLELRLTYGLLNTGDDPARPGMHNRVISLFGFCGF